MDDQILTDKEVQALTLLAQGEPIKVIAGKMSITYRTVWYHLDRARDRLGTRNWPHTVAQAVARQLIKIERIE